MRRTGRILIVVSALVAASGAATYVAYQINVAAQQARRNHGHD